MAQGGVGDDGWIASVLVLWATMTGARDAQKTVKELTAQAIVPDVGMANALAMARNAVGLVADDHPSALSSMEPDILGEFFCLKFLAYFTQGSPIEFGQIANSHLFQSQIWTIKTNGTHFRTYKASGSVSLGMSSDCPKESARDEYRQIVLWLTGAPALADPDHGLGFVRHAFGTASIENSIRADDVQMFEKLCAQFSVDMQTGFGRSPVFLAAEAGSRVTLERVDRERTESHFAGFRW